MVITLSGDNTYQLNQRIKELSSGFSEQFGEMGLQKLDAADLSFQSILEAVQNLPFLVERKMIILRGLSENSEMNEAIEQIIDSTDEQIDLVIVEPGLDKRSKLYKSLQKLTKFEDYSLTAQSDLPQWVVSETARQGGVISPADARYLVERLGPNQQLLAVEIEKLRTYHPKINRENIQLLTEPTPQSKIFDMLEAAFSGNKKLALSLYENERSQRVEPQALLAMLAWQLRAIAAVKLAVKNQNVASDFGINPYVVSKSKRLADNLSLEKLKQLVGEAVEIDYKSKSTNLDLDETLKTYLLTITS